jgi:hypothetical protein
MILLDFITRHGSTDDYYAGKKRIFLLTGSIKKITGRTIHDQSITT